MARNYALGRIRHALREAKGNNLKARQQIIAWTYEDHKFLLELVRPHLKGIIGHAMGHVESLVEKESIEPISEPAVDLEGTEFGKEILQSIAEGGALNFGQAHVGPPLKKTAASQRHIDAMKALAAHSGTKSNKT